MSESEPVASTSAGTLGPARRSFSDIVFPPSLAHHPDPFVPFAPYSLTGDDDDNDTVSSADDRDHIALQRDEYKDSEESDDSKDEKARLVQDEAHDVEGDDERWALRDARVNRRRLLLLAFPVVGITVLLITFLASHVFSGKHTYRGEGLKPISWDHIANGTFSVERHYLDWLAEAGDGVYSYRTDEGSIVLQDVRTNTSRFLVKGSDIVYGRRKLDWQTFQVSADMKYILFTSKRTKLWRHSTISDFYVYSLATGTTTVLHKRALEVETSIATWSPVNHHIAYVHKNDLYVYDTPPENDTEPRTEVVRITMDGSATTFNGVPDWVYEEEVFSSDSALWWAPDGSKLAYLSFDEKKVPEYDFPIYNPNPFAPGGVPYPKSTVMRYPKPGFPNPTVTLHVFDLIKYLALPARPAVNSNYASLNSRVVASTYLLQFDKSFDPADLIISEVTWVGKNDLMVKFSNRISTVQRVAHFYIGEMVEEEGDEVVVGTVVREDDWGAKDGGWAEPGQFIVGIDATVMLHSNQAELAAPIPSYPPGYLDVVPNPEGFSHIAYFSPPDSPTPLFLTGGEWEIEDTIQAVDVVRGLIYFVAANPSIERHLYSVPLPSVQEFAAFQKGEARPAPPTALTDTTVRGYHRTSFSPFAGFYVLNYDGPEVPWQRLIKVDDKHFEDVLADNANLAKVAASFQTPSVNYSTLMVNGNELNVMELRPPFMDDSGRTKYPVLFSVYGGPASQVVNTVWKRDWHHYLCTTYNYVIVYVDPRGTGYKGRTFRAPIHGKLGMLEANDTVDAARHWATLPYIDEKRVGIWGWSYGGFLTSKVIETDSAVFTLGMAVAPVTSWLYYDSIYTERYMADPKSNTEGYDESAVTKMDGFAHADFALAHGSGDDNVHFLNSAVLLDRLTVAGVKHFGFRLFTDSDHSMSMRNAYWELMPWLADFLYGKWGDGERTKQKWKSKHASE